MHKDGIQILFLFLFLGGSFLGNMTRFLDYPFYDTHDTNGTFSGLAAGFQ